MPALRSVVIGKESFANCGRVVFESGCCGVL